MGRGKDHVPAGTILETHHLVADLSPATSLFPEVGWLGDWHRKFVAVDGFHFLAQDVFDFECRPFAERQERVNPRAKLALKARSGEQSRADGVDAGRRFTECCDEKSTESHWRLYPFPYPR